MFWMRKRTPNSTSPTENVLLIERKFLAYTRRSPERTITLTTLRIMFAIQKLVCTLIARHPAHLLVGFLNLAPYLEEVLEMSLESRRQEVQRPIRLVPGRHHNVVLDQHLQVVPHGLVVQVHRRREGVRIVWATPQQVDDLRAVQPAPRPDDEMPQPLVQGTRGSMAEVL